MKNHLEAIRIHGKKLVDNNTGSRLKSDSSEHLYQRDALFLFDVLSVHLESIMKSYT